MTKKYLLPSAHA